MRTAAASSNAGTGSIGGGALTSLVSGASVPTSPAVTLAFQAGNQLAITAGPVGTTFVDANGNPIAGAAAYNSGDTYRVQIPNLGIFEFAMTGGPQVGDTFSLTDNTGALAGTGTGVGDNRNARRLADLQNARVMLGGTASFANTYGSLVADVGDLAAVVEDGRTGAVVRTGWAEAIEALAAAPERTSEMGRAARAHLERAWAGQARTPVADAGFADWIRG